MAKGLERRLGLFSVITISMSSMIGSGIFVLPGLAFSMTGPSVYLAFLLSAITIIPAALSKAELATAMPTSGGAYIYLERTFGPLAGTITGLGLFLSILLKAAFSLVGFKAYLTVLTDANPLNISLLFLVGIVLLNIFGVKKVSSFLTAILLMTIVSMGFLAFSSLTSIQTDNLRPLFTNGMSGFLATTALVFVSFAGVTKVAAIAEEVDDPEKNLPRGIILSLLLVTAIYCFISFVLAGVFPTAELANNLEPIYLLAKMIGGETVGAFFAIIATLTMVNTANAGVLAGSRFPFAMARDNLLPSFLGKLHKKYLTPIKSIILSGIIIGVVLITVDVGKIAKLASAFMICIYILENLSVIVLRESRAQWYTPGYKSPLYPMLQVFGVVSGIGLLIAMGKIALFAIIIIAVPGAFLYFFYSAQRTSRKGVVGIRGKRKDLLQEYPNDIGGFCSFDVQGDAQIVVGLFGRERSSEMLIEMGLALAEHKVVEVANIIEIPEQTDIHDLIEEPANLRSLRRRVKAMAEDKDELIMFDSVVSHDVSRTVFEISQRLHCKWLIIEWGGRSRGSVTLHNPIGWLKSHLHCHLAIFRDAGIRYIRNIMVLLNEDEHDELVLEISSHLASVFKAGITFTVFMSANESEERINLKTEELKKLCEQYSRNTTAKIVQGDNKLTSLIQETCYYDLLILGNRAHTLLNSITGTFNDKLFAKANCSVLGVHKGYNHEA